MKKHRILKVVLIAFLSLQALVLLAVGLVLGMYFYRSNPRSVKEYDTTNPFIHKEHTLSAHRSGGGINPEETMMAFVSCAEDPDLDVSTFEFDLHITKDDVLVLIHDGLLDRTSNVEEIFGKTNVKVEDMTLSELKRLNMGAKFVADDGSMPYAELTEEETPEELKIVTLDEILTYLSSVNDYSYIIEIKNSGTLGEKSADILHETILAHDLIDRVVVGSFHEDVAHYLDATYPDLKRGAYTAEVLEFYLAVLTNKQDFTVEYDALQLPFADYKNSYFVNLGTAKVINYAHKHNLAVQYWTINEAKDMEYLWSIGADCIMSDYPDVATDVKRSMD